jgi:hypothetical protein
MKHLKTFESHSINEEFNTFDLNKWLSSAAGVLSTALNIVLLKWGKIPEIWKNIGQYHILMDVVKHLSEITDLHGHGATESEWIDLIKDYTSEKGDEDVIIKYPRICKSPSINDLSMAYTLMSYDGDLELDIRDSINLIDDLSPEKKEKIKDVKISLEQFLTLIQSYKNNENTISISEL